MRQIKRKIAAVDSSDGAGVKLKRSIGRNTASRVDPFLLLDAFSSDDPDDYIAGFPPHPHRGFETVTYMLDGHMLHKDHLGNEGDLRAGGVQWMTAGKGVIHEERPQQANGLLRGFQLWLNLPAKDKWQPAAYQNIEPEQVPEVSTAGCCIKVIAGELQLNEEIVRGPIATAATQALYLDIQLQAGVAVTLPVAAGLNAAIYPFEGEVLIAQQTAELNTAHELGQGDQVSLSSEQGGRCLLLAGKAINEPVAQYGPFVMNTMDEVEQAIQDYRAGVLVD